MKECSNGKLDIIPATGPDVTFGVLNMRFSDINFNGMTYREVGMLIASRLYEMNIDYNTRIFLMPDIVDFSGAAAWAQISGNTIWLKDAYASFPIVQVHEYGHLLGQHHSGANGNSYSDSTCYMGNQIPWTDHGAFMCFNPAKTWYFGWYDDHHKEINPTNAPFNQDIVGIDDVSNGKAGDNMKVIIRITGDQNKFFLMYNRAKGINSEALSGADELVITKQNSAAQNSNLVEFLGNGEQWVYNNFASTGKNLVVKNCYTTQDTPNGDIARVLIYIEGINDQQCPGAGNNGNNNNNNGGSDNNNNNNESCTDKDWVDDYGDSCSWYATNNRCNILGEITGTNDWTANEACCVCGGGHRVGSNGGGGSCVTDDSWYDSGGPNYDCEWYATTPNACNLFGHRFTNFGETANSACCVCKE